MVGSLCCCTNLCSLGHTHIPENRYQQLAVCPTDAKSTSSVTVFGGEKRVNGLGKLPGVLGGQVGCVLGGKCVLGQVAVPAWDRPRVPAADPSPAPGPRVTLCHATQHLDQETAVACCVIFLKAHFLVRGGSRWKAEPLKGRYFERPPQAILQ